MALILRHKLAYNRQRSGAWLTETCRARRVALPSCGSVALVAFVEGVVLALVFLEVAPGWAPPPFAVPASVATFICEKKANGTKETKEARR